MDASISLCSRGFTLLCWAVMIEGLVTEQYLTILYEYIPKGIKQVNFILWTGSQIRVHANRLGNVLPSPVYAILSNSYHCMIQTDTSEDKVNPGAINVLKIKSANQEMTHTHTYLKYSERAFS